MDRGEVGEFVVRLALAAQESGLDGVIASPQEIQPIRQAIPDPNFLIVTPGVRSKDAVADDQKRVMTAEEAIVTGADYVVIGRPIVRAADPVEAAKRFADEIYLAGMKRSIPPGQASPL